MGWLRRTLKRGKTSLEGDTLVLASGVHLKLAGGSPFLYAGASASPLALNAAGSYGLRFYLQSTATSGYLQGLYLQVKVAGAGGSGIGTRPRVTVTADGAQGYGSHATLDFGSAAGSLSGLGCALRANLIVPNRALLGGTYTGLQGEIYCAGTDSDISGVTEHSVLRLCVDGGDATAQNLIKNLIAVKVTAGTDGTGNMVYTHSHDAGNAAGSLRILVNGTARYLKFWAAE